MVSSTTLINCSIRLVPRKSPEYRHFCRLEKHFRELKFDHFLLCFQQQADDPECFLGHTEPKVTVIIILSAILIILLFTYLAYGRICLEAVALQKRRQTTQPRPQQRQNYSLQRISKQNTNSPKLRDGQSSTMVVSSSLNPSRPRPRNNRHKRAGTYVFILLLVFTISWMPLIVLIIYDFKVHAFADETLLENLEKHQCYGKGNSTKFISLRYIRYMYALQRNTFW